MSALATGAPIALDVELRDLIQPHCIALFACYFVATSIPFGMAISLAGCGKVRRDHEILFV